MSRTTPSFNNLKPASAASARAKQGNRSCDTLHEVQLRCELWRMGLRYRKNVATMPGKPDIVFPGSKVAIFCDGDFWHGRNWDKLKTKLEGGHNANYWPAKIARNMERDRRNTMQLENEGWLVIRIWETDIRRDPAGAAASIAKAIQDRQEPCRA